MGDLVICPSWVNSVSARPAPQAGRSRAADPPRRWPPPLVRRRSVRTHRRGGAHPFGRPAKTLQHCQPRGPRARGDQPIGQRGGRVAIAQRRDDAAAARQMRRSRAKGAACRPRVTTSSSRQPSRAAASDSTPGAGRAHHSWRSSTAAMLPPARTRRDPPRPAPPPAAPQRQQRRQSKGTGQARPRAPTPARPGGAGRQDDLGRRQRAQACAGQAVRSIFGDPDDRQPRVRHATHPAAGRHE